jgi:hypothetical protein
MVRPEQRRNGMATLTNVTLSIVRDVANAEMTVEYDIVWNAFDRETNVQYLEALRFIGDDTGQDGDDANAGDDAINTGLSVLTLVSANGAASTHRTKLRTIEFDLLNEDVGDDEIRAVVTLTPQLPTATSRESTAATVNA